MFNQKVNTMKKLMIVAALLMVGVATVTTAVPVASEVVMNQGDEKVKIKLADLPEAVKATLQTEPYTGWTIENVYHNKTQDHYEVEVKKGTEKKTLKFSKDGKAIE